MRVLFNAQMRSSATSPWMHSTATQYEFFAPPARLFYMNAALFGVPFDIFHRYVDCAATFQVRIASLFSMVDKNGPVLTQRTQRGEPFCDRLTLEPHRPAVGDKADRIGRNDSPPPRCDANTAW